MVNVSQQALARNVFVKRVHPVFYVNEVSLWILIDFVLSDSDLFFVKFIDHYQMLIVHSIVNQVVPVF